MKRSLVLFVVLLALAAAGCAAAPPPAEPNTPAPCIFLEGNCFYAPDMPVYELPQGYEYAGVLDEAAAHTTGLAGTEYYTDPAQQPLTDLYTRQLTGTPVGSDTVDTTRLQWMYVHWQLPDE